jgi:hypothetical protein
MKALQGASSSPARARATLPDRVSRVGVVTTFARAKRNGESPRLALGGGPMTTTTGSPFNLHHKYLPSSGLSFSGGGAFGALLAPLAAAGFADFYIGGSAPDTPGRPAPGLTSTCPAVA